MLKSMTGFGRAEYEDENLSFKIEIKSVNHRYSEVSIRLPKILNAIEDKIKKLILNKLSRGRIDVFITARYDSDENKEITVDKNMVLAYHKALNEIANTIGVKSQDGLLNDDLKEIIYLANLPGAISKNDSYVDPNEFWDKILPQVELAVDNLVNMRIAEGNNMYDDLVKRAEIIEEKLVIIETNSPKVVSDYREKLIVRINDFLNESKQEIDPNRIIQEVAIYSDKVNITEEIVRLHSHLKQFHDMIESKTPVGRKLDFLIQEFNREANTIASKSNEAVITKEIVDIKGEIEKIREQIQNIE